MRCIDGNEVYIITTHVASAWLNQKVGTQNHYIIVTISFTVASSILAMTPFFAR